MASGNSANLLRHRAPPLTGHELAAFGGHCQNEGRQSKPPTHRAYYETDTVDLGAVPVGFSGWLNALTRPRLTPG
ncbi:MAG TPA: hypothetical protein V6D02_01710 [Candidatus Obscuribacterales bacterium]